MVKAKGVLMNMRSISVLGAAVALSALTLALAQGMMKGVTVAKGLNGPQGVLVARDGSVYVVDAGLGGRTKTGFKDPDTNKMVTVRIGNSAHVYHVKNGRSSVIASLPSIVIETGTPGGETMGGGRLAILGDQLYVSSGGWFGPAGPKPYPKMDVILKVFRDGSSQTVANLWKLEASQNPGGFGVLDSHAYGLAVGPDGALWMPDAAANDLLRYDPNTKKLEVVTVFDGVPFPADAKLPPELAKGNPIRGGKMETDPVPTGIAFDENGNAYVSLLPGEPFLPGSGKIIKVTPKGEKSEFLSGLTMPTDIRRGPDGNFYVVQFAMTGEKGPMPMSGSVLRVGMDGKMETVLEKLMFPTGGVGAPGSGSVVMYKGLASRGM
jgi:DNA-binding beta-propeller fold protein YncE